MRRPDALRVNGGSIDREWESGSFSLWESNRRIGHLHWLLLPEVDREDAIRIADLVIEKEERGKGYGRKLLEHFQTVARQQGFTTVILIMVEQESLGFWQHMGYEGGYGIGKGFYKNLR